MSGHILVGVSEHVHEVKGKVVDTILFTYAQFMILMMTDPEVSGHAQLNIIAS